MKKSRVILINPPSSFLSDDLMYPNLGLCYLFAVLKNAGVESELIDLAGGVNWSILNDCRNDDIIAISSTTPQFPIAKQVLAYLRLIAPGAWIVVGGPGATVAPEDYLSAGFDQAVIGEGERAIIDIAFGSKVQKIKRAYISGLDLIPFPDRTTLDRYHGPATIMTSRGCPWGKCSFCCRTWNGVRFRSAQNVALELKEIKQGGYDTVVLYDMEFFAFTQRDGQIVEALGKLDFTWRCFSRADYLLKNETLLALAAANGLTEVFIGVESATDSILEANHKGTTAEINYNAIKLLQKYGVLAKAAIIIGLPGETEESLDNMEKWIDKTKPDTIAPSLLVVMPGCDIWEHPERYDIVFNREGAYAPFRKKPGTYVPTVSTQGLSAGALVEAQKYFDNKYSNMG